MTLQFDSLTMAEVDVDGAVREAADAPADDTRADFFRKAALGSGGLLAGGTILGALPEVAGAQTRRDQEILNFALTLEYLEAEFYTQAIRGAGLSGDLLRLTRIVSNHENIHVRTLRSALGRRAVAKPRFDFKDTVTNAGKFLDTAIVLEDTGVAAYAGQGPRLQTRSIVEVALSIHSVEARHAAALNTLTDQIITPDGAFAKPADAQTVLDSVQPFIVS